MVSLILEVDLDYLTANENPPDHHHHFDRDLKRIRMEESSRFFRIFLDHAERVWLPLVRETTAVVIDELFQFRAQPVQVFVRLLPPKPENPAMASFLKSLSDFPRFDHCTHAASLIGIRVVERKQLVRSLMNRPTSGVCLSKANATSTKRGSLGNGSPMMKWNIVFALLQVGPSSQ